MRFYNVWRHRLIADVFVRIGGFFLYYVYMLSCRDGSLYTGITTDPLRRLKQHNEGTGAKYTRARRPARMVYLAPCGDRSAASKREYAIKQLPREEKLRLIESEDNIIPEAGS